MCVGQRLSGIKLPFSNGILLPARLLYPSASPPLPSSSYFFLYYLFILWFLSYISSYVFLIFLLVLLYLPSSSSIFFTSFLLHVFSPLFYLHFSPISSSSSSYLYIVLDSFLTYYFISLLTLSLVHISLPIISLYPS